MNTKLIGSLVGYAINNIVVRATVINTSGSSALVRDEQSGKWIAISISQIRWING
jgi:hypothetical protein